MKPLDLVRISRVVRSFAIVLPRAFVLLAAVQSPVRAQPADAAVSFSSFEVASIRPSKPGDESPEIWAKADGMRIRACTLWDIIEWAYGIHRYGDHPIVGLPRWAGVDRFDIEAKVTEADAAELRKLNSEEQWNKLGAMLQALLAERFQLVLHKRPIQLSIFELTVAKGGPKLKDGKPEAGFPRGRMYLIPGRIVAKGVPIVRLSEVLGAQVERGVVDQTSLAGTYDFILEWQPQENSPSSVAEIWDGPPDPSPLSNSSKPAILAALKEQLGLMLKPAKGPGEALVIDHLEKPSPN